MAKSRRSVARTLTPPMPDMSWAWFFDVDGTLVEIAPSPTSVVVHHDLPNLIEQVHSMTGGAVSLITGRAVSDIDRFLPFSAISIVGQHGLEVRSQNGPSVAPSGTDANLDEVKAALEDAAARHPGLLVEFKGESIALHYRKAPRLAAYAHRLMRSLRDRHVPEYTIRKGKRVVEIVPHGADKGVAIQKLMELKPFKGRVPVFLGDDVTDESGFAVVNEMSGVSIKVGRGPTAAAWRLKDVTAVREWLRDGVKSAKRTGN